jgi:hypothetical protein
MGEIRNIYTIVFRKDLNVRDHLGDLGVDGRITILK